jgi:hypothetical protein
MLVILCSLKNFIISNIVIIFFILFIIQLFLICEPAIKIYGYSPPFPEQEIIDDNRDYVNMSTNSITNNGYRPTDIISVDYYSNGKTLNATLWLLFPFQKNPTLNEVDYGMFIDSDFNSKTGFGGIDYKIELQWKKDTNSWTYVIETWSPYGERKQLVNKPNYTDFYEEGGKYVTLSLDLEQILYPKKYKVLFYADSRKNDGGILIMDFTRWIAIPPLQLALSTNPNSIEIEKGTKNNVEVIINSTYGYEPTVNLYTTNQSKDIDFDFASDNLRIPSFGQTSTSLTLNVSQAALEGPRTLFIFANSSFPPEQLIKPKVKVSNRFSNYTSSIPTENILTHASVSIKVEEPPDWFTQIGQGWEKIGGVTQFIYGIIFGISPWIYERFKQRKKKNKNRNSINQKRLSFQGSPFK